MIESSQNPLQREGFRGHLSELTGAVIKAFFIVYNELGPGFLESVYRRALCVALAEAGLKAVEEASIEVFFHGTCVGVFRADVLVEGCLILELKVSDEITKAFEAQLLHYLRATNVEVGLILAFGGTFPKHRRLALHNENKHRKS